MSGVEPAPASRTEVAGTIAIVVAACAIALLPPLFRRLAAHPTAEECADLVERWAEHSTRQAEPEAAASVIATRRGEARLRSWTIGRCEAELTEAEARCARAAQNADEFERCVQ